MELTQSNKTALLLGATGLVGQHLLRELLADTAYSKIIAPARRRLDVNDPKLDNPVINFDRLASELRGMQCNDVFICLGTTMKQAGSAEAFRRVDFDYVVIAAHAARAAGASQCLLVSSVGADPKSSFLYVRTKGETEEALRDMDFWALHIFRPGTLIGNREEFRPAERLAGLATRLLRSVSPALLGKYNPTDADVLARKMLEAARGFDGGVHLYEARSLVA